MQIYRLISDQWVAPGRDAIDPGGTTPGGPDYITFSDFTGSDYAGIDYFNTNTSIIGNGITRTVYQMVANTSSRASYVASLASGDTNQCHLIRAGGKDGSHIETGLEFGNFTLAGTEQGHIYNGLEVGYSTGANIHDIKITHIPGNDIAPPGETFLLNLWHANNATITNVVLDGQGVAATISGNNNLDSVTYTNCTFTGSGSAMPGATWQCSNMTFDSCILSNCPRGWNVENPYGGFHTFKNCRFDDFPIGWQIVCQAGVWVAPNASVASTVLTVEDPKRLDGTPWNFTTDGPFKILHYPTSQKPANRQKDSDIHLVVDGVDVSSDTSKLLLVTE
jgi:hypothetical protein